MSFFVLITIDYTLNIQETKGSYGFKAPPSFFVARFPEQERVICRQKVVLWLKP